MKPAAPPAAGRAPSLAEVQAGGFPMGGEPLAVDLADTIIMATTPPTDLIADQAAADLFWTLHAGLLPPGWGFPSAEATRRLRAAIRLLLDAAQQATEAEGAALDELNAVAASVPSSPQVALRGGQAQRWERWHAADPAELALAAAARSAIDVLTLAALRSNLRRCASPACSMLYVSGDARRRWCTPNLCGNRDRAARHYRRHREAP